MYTEMYDLHNRAAALEQENTELKQEVEHLKQRLRMSGKTTGQKLVM